MRTSRCSGGIIAGGALVLVMIVVASAPAEARSRRGGDGGVSDRGGVPYLNVKGSCMDAQKFSAGDDKNLAFRGCMQDETNAKSELDKRWSSFKGKDRSNCVEQSRFPSPSYVEVLTCLEMSSDSMRNMPRSNLQPGPQIGGPVAPGLSPTPAPGGTAAPPPPTSPNRP